MAILSTALFNLKSLASLKYTGNGEDQCHMQI
jgi:hypothetical protein